MHYLFKPWDIAVAVIAHTYAILSVAPFLTFPLLWFGIYAIYRDKKKATQWAVDVTAVLLIGAVSSMMFRVFETRSGFFVILLVLLIGYGLLGNVQYRKKGALNHLKIIRTLLRVFFLLLSFAYVVLLIVGIGKYIGT